MEKLRLAIFNTQPPHLYYGGVERRIIETAKRLQNQADVTIYSGTKAGFKTPITLEHVKIVPCKSTDNLFPIDNWFYNRSLTKTAEVYNSDIFEAHNVSGYKIPDKLAKIESKKPFVHVIHGTLADEYEKSLKDTHQSIRNKLANRFMKYQAKIEEQTAKKATCIVTISKYSREKILNYYKVDESKIRIVPNGVDIKKFVPLNDSASKKQLNPDDDISVLFVGSLIPRKGLNFLIEAAKKIVKQSPNVKFKIVGDGPLKNHLVDSLKQNSILSNFVFLGNIKEDALPAVYSSADVFVLPSIQEGQGIVLLEAQACGKPVVAFDIGGINEAVCNGESGLLVKRGDSDALADALTTLLSDRSLRNRLGINGRKFVSENFTWDKCATGMLNVYREALNSKNAL